MSKRFEPPNTPSQKMPAISGLTTSNRGAGCIPEMTHSHYLNTIVRYRRLGKPALGIKQIHSYGLNLLNYDLK